MACIVMACIGAVADNPRSHSRRVILWLLSQCHSLLCEEQCRPPSEVEGCCHCGGLHSVFRSAHSVLALGANHRRLCPARHISLGILHLRGAATDTDALPHTGTDGLKVQNAWSCKGWVIQLRENRLQFQCGEHFYTGT